jgi:ABC-2 type transport system permease protein
MRIYFRELKANFKSLLIYCGISLFFLTVGFAKFQGYADNPELLDVLNGLPDAMLDAFSMNAFNLTTVEGFFGVMFVFIGLILSIAAVMWGSDIIAKEERDKTVEFSLTLPVRRSTMIAAKSAVVVTNSILLALFTWGITLANTTRYDPEPSFYKFVALGMIAIFIMQLIFLAVGVLLGAAVKNHKRASSIAISILLGTYFLSIIAGLNEDFEKLKYLTPFKFFDPADLLHDGKIEPVFLWLSLGIFVICMVSAYLAYSRRDLYI